jgi:hypothetical protein
VSLVGDVSGSLRVVALAPPSFEAAETPPSSQVPVMVGADGVTHESDTKVAVVAYADGEDTSGIFHKEDSGGIEVADLTAVDHEAWPGDAPQDEEVGLSLKPFIIAVVILTLILILGVVGIVVKVLTGEEPDPDDLGLADPVGEVVTDGDGDDGQVEDPEVIDPVVAADDGDTGIALSMDGGDDEDEPDVIELSEEIAVELVTQPTGGTLWQDGTVVGIAPYTFRFSSDEDPVVEVRIELGGYVTSRVTVAPSAAPTLVVPMQRRARVAPRVKPKEKPTMKVVP